MNALTIQEAAQITDWSPRMLRYIERAGLIEPQRSESGYRLYGAGELQRLPVARLTVTRQTEQYVDMLSAGILDPAKVVRIALQDAASIAGLMITTEAMVGDRPSKDAPAMPGGGGMGGMDY